MKAGTMARTVSRAAAFGPIVAIPPPRPVLARPLNSRTWPEGIEAVIGVGEDLRPHPCGVAAREGHADARRRPVIGGAQQHQDRHVGSQSPVCRMR